MADVVRVYVRSGHLYFRQVSTHIAPDPGNVTTVPDSSILESPEILKAVLESLPVGVWIMDHDGRIIQGNDAGRRIWGGARYVGIEQFGEYKGWWRDTGKLIRSEEWAAARAINKGETSINEEIEIECFDGTRKIILNSALPIRDDAGEIVGGIIVNVDITDRIGMEERLRLAAETDELTQALNRRRFLEVLDEEINRAVRYARPLSLIMFDVDRLKEINDSGGHEAGDRALVWLCEVVRSAVRKNESLARFGGDEFMLLLPETRLQAAIKTADRLCKSLAQRRDAAPAPLACSFGVCEYAAEETGDEFIRRVDQALYKAKSEGRGCVSAYPAPRS